MNERIDNPNYIVNPDDIAENFWQHNYIISLTRCGFSFLVNAEYEGSALDEVMDYIVDIGGLEGLYQEYNEEDVDYISAGNYSYQFTTLNIRIDEV